MRSFRHWTPRYVWDRLMLMAYQHDHPDAPWLNRRTIEILEGWLSPGDRGLEWGSGRSTIWFAQRVGSLVSVEHNPRWHSRVSAELKDKGLNNVDYRLCPDEDEYCSTAASFPPDSFDFCLVDGEYRDRCALAALGLVKPGGVLIVDNYNWYLPSESRSPHSRRTADGPQSEGWAEFQKKTSGWRRILSSNGVFDTSLWFRPRMK